MADYGDLVLLQRQHLGIKRQLPLHDQASAAGFQLDQGLPAGDTAERPGCCNSRHEAANRGESTCLPLATSRFSTVFEHRGASGVLCTLHENTAATVPCEHHEINTSHDCRRRWRQAQSSRTMPAAPSCAMAQLSHTPSRWWAVATFHRPTGPQLFPCTSSRTHGPATGGARTIPNPNPYCQDL